MKDKEPNWLEMFVIVNKHEVATCMAISCLLLGAFFSVISMDIFSLALQEMGFEGIVAVAGPIAILSILMMELFKRNFYWKYPDHLETQCAMAEAEGE